MLFLENFHKIYFFEFKNRNRVKPVSNDHLGDEVSAVVIDRWSLKRRPAYNV